MKSKISLIFIFAKLTLPTSQNRYPLVLVTFDFFGFFYFLHSTITIQRKVHIFDLAKTVFKDDNDVRNEQR